MFKLGGKASSVEPKKKLLRFRFSAWEEQGEEIGAVYATQGNVQLTD